MITICVGFFVIQLDATVVNVALPSIGRSLGGTLARVFNGVVDAYTLALAGFMLTAGSDRRSPGGAAGSLLVGICVFTSGSAGLRPGPRFGSPRGRPGISRAWCGRAPLPCSLALIVHAYPDHTRRAWALGTWGAMGSIGMACGPALGGMLIDSLGDGGPSSSSTCRSACFRGDLAPTPIRGSAESPTRRPDRFDVGGLACSIVALTCAHHAAFIAAGAARLQVRPLHRPLGGGGEYLSAAAFPRHRATPARPHGAARSLPPTYLLFRRGDRAVLQPEPVRAVALPFPLPATDAPGVTASDRLAVAPDGGRCCLRLGDERPADWADRSPDPDGRRAGVRGGRSSMVLATVSPGTSLLVLLFGTLALGLCFLDRHAGHVVDGRQCNPLGTDRRDQRDLQHGASGGRGTRGCHPRIAPGLHRPTPPIHSRCPGHTGRRCAGRRHGDGLGCDERGVRPASAPGGMRSAE